MGLTFSDDSFFDESEINNAIDLRISLNLVTHSLPTKTQEYMSLLLSKYLKECGLGDYFNKLNYCLSEILVNAIKANLKRIYFQEKNLNIENAADYEEGMKTFRQDTLKNRAHYTELLRTSNYYVNYSLKINQDNLIIEVRNNSVMTPMETKRVREKIAAMNNSSLENMFSGPVDETEGAGLGIKSILVTLNSFGLPGDNYQLFTEGNETVAKLIIGQPQLLEI